MIEFEVDMGYLLECDELDKVVLNDENGEHEPMEFVPADATVGNGTDLSKRLREVHGLHAFAELFGFDWYDESDWSWHDVACAMADAIDATVGTEPDEATMLKLHGRMNAALLDMQEELLAYHPQDRENASSKELIDCVIRAHQIIEDAATVGVGTCQIETTESWLPAERYHRCKHCGAFFAVLDASHDIPPRVCPNCGRRIEVSE